MLNDVVKLLQTFDHPWFVAGGWAISLFLKRQIRPHSDVDIGIFRTDQVALREFLSDWQFFIVEETQPVLSPLERYLQPPVFEIHAYSFKNEIEFLLHDLHQGLWVFRRNPAIKLPVEKLFRRSITGIPYLSPEITLLFKAKNPGEIAELDFETVRPHLDGDEKKWLAEVIDLCYPGHPWLSFAA